MFTYPVGFNKSSVSSGVDPYAANVVLYLKGDGANNSTTIVDSSPSPKTLTRYGNTKISTTQGKYGGSSIYVAGGTDCLETNYLTDFSPWSVNYTLEAWVYASSFSTWSKFVVSENIPVLIGRVNRENINNEWSFGVDNTNTLAFYYYSNSQLRIIKGANNTVSLNSWNHIAMTNTASGITLFTNGIASSVTPIVGTPVTASYPLTIGRYYANSLTGYLDSIRITKNVARYSANFNTETDTYLAY